MAATWGANRWLKMTLEATWGVFDAGASAGNILWIRLLEDAFNMDGNPIPWETRSADGGNLRTETGTRKESFAGSLRAMLRPSQAPKLVPWGATPIGTGAARTMQSYTMDYFDGVEVIRSLGVCPSKMTIASDENSDNAMINFNLVAKDQATGVTLAEPASTVFPTDRPYHHGDIVGQVLVGGSTISGIRSLGIDFDNKLHHPFHESSRIDRMRYKGRDVNVMMTLADPTSVGRTRFEGQTAVATAIGWAVTTPAAHNVTFDCQGKTYYGTRTRTSRFEEDIYEVLNIKAFKDDTTGVDCATVAA